MKKGGSHPIARLISRHPKIFAKVLEDGTPLPLPEDRINVGDGWFDLVDVLCTLLQKETDENGAPQLVAGRVKGKFDTLRFQCVGPRSEAQRGMIDLARELSARIAED